MNALVPDALDERVINSSPSGDAQIVRFISLGELRLLANPKLLVIQKEENWNLCLNSGKAIGCRVNGISLDDLMDGEPQALLRLTWEIIKVHHLNGGH